MPFDHIKANKNTPPSTPYEAPTSSRSSRVPLNYEAGSAALSPSASSAGGSGLSTMNYSAGSAALSPNLQLSPTTDGNAATTAQPERERPTTALAGYESLLGEFLGGELYGLVKKHLSADELLNMAHKTLSSGASSLAEGLQPTSGLGGAMDDELEANAVRNFATALLSSGAEYATEWLKSEKGTAFRNDIAQWFEGHPKAVVGLAILAAAGAYLANAPAPELNMRFNVGGGLSASAGVNLGKLREMAIRGAYAGLYWKGRAVTAGLTYTHSDDGANTLGLNARHETEGRILEGVATIADDGSLVIDTGATFTNDAYRAALGISHTDDSGGSATVGRVSLRLGDETNNVTANTNYDLSAGRLTISTTTLNTYDWGRLRTSHTPHDDGSITYGTGADITLRRNFEMSFDYAMNELRGDVLSGSFTRRWGDTTSLSGGLTYNSDDSRLTALSLKFGYKDPEEFKAFIASYKRSYSGDIATDKLDLMVEMSMGRVMTRLQNTAIMGNGNMVENVTRAHLATPLSRDWTAIAGVRHGYQNDPGGSYGLNDNSNGTWMELGLQYRKVPLVIGWRPEDDALTFGVVIPFGR